MFFRKLAPITNYRKVSNGGKLRLRPIQIIKKGQMGTNSDRAHSFESEANIAFVPFRVFRGKKQYFQLPKVQAKK